MEILSPLILIRELTSQEIRVLCTAHVIREDGTQEWFSNGNRHSTGGLPLVVYPNERVHGGGKRANSAKSALNPNYT